MRPTTRIYLDHAATSWPKSPAVLDAMDTYARQTGAASGRGAYRSASLANETIQTARRSIARLINAASTNCVSFHSSGTTALNAAIFGLVSAGDHVVTTAADHNSVLRPLHELQKTSGIELTIVPSDPFGRVCPDAVLAATRPETRLVVITHASNVTGAVQDVTAVGQSLRDRKTIFAIDAAQTLGYLPVDVQQISCDVLAAPGHKGLGGPLGTGLLYVRNELHDSIRPCVFGGTGSQSESLEMPTSFPDKVEAGNLNVPAIAGLATAAEQMEQVDFDERSHCLAKLSEMLVNGLNAIEHVNIHSRPGALAIASLSMDGLPAGDFAAILDAEYGIEVRAGFHCAALIQECLGNPDGGTLRISAGPATSDQEVLTTIEAVDAIASACL